MTEEQAIQEERDAFLKLKAADDAHEQAKKEWRDKRAVMKLELRKRLPREDELVFGRADCDCGRPMAYREHAHNDAWECAAVLLGLTVASGRHVKLPFAFYEVKRDPSRKTLERADDVAATSCATHQTDS